jgi:hypothetical protein
MNYQMAYALYESRQKGKDFKPWKNGNIHIKYNHTNGHILFYRLTYTWENQKGKYNRVVQEATLFASLSPTSDLRFEVDTAPNDNQAKNFATAIIGAGYVYSDVTKYKLSSHKVRLDLRLISREPKTELPFGKGLVINTNTFTVVAIPALTEKTTDKEAAKPIIKYTREVLKVMDVLHRVGTFTEDKSKMWTERKKALDNCNVADMTEESMALLAEQAYTAAKSKTSEVDRFDFVLDENGNRQDDKKRGWGYLQAEIPEHIRAKRQYERIRKNAGVVLREYLKGKHDAYKTTTTTVVTTSPRS